MEQSIYDCFGDLDIPEVSIERGKVVCRARMVPKDAPQGIAFVDQLSFTFNDDFENNALLRAFTASVGGGIGEISDEGVVEHQVNSLLRYIFGLEVCAKRAAGLNFYRDTWSLNDGAGMVSIGGQAGTILVQITGHGMACAFSGWQKRLHEVRQLMTRCVITRIDLAYDDHEGRRYSVDKALSDYLEGHFTMRGRPPSAEQRGNWLLPDGKGRTFYVGKRENGKMLRVYEKGRQLGDPDSEWVRVELELHNKDRVIPWDLIDCPECYLAGAYSALLWVCDAEKVERISTLRKVAMMTYECMIGHLKRSYGGLINVILSVEESALDRFVAVGDRRPMPKRLDLALLPLSGGE